MIGGTCNQEAKDEVEKMHGSYGDGLKVERNQSRRSILWGRQVTGAAELWEEEGREERRRRNMITGQQQASVPWQTILHQRENG